MRLLPEAIHRWQAAGVDTSALHGIDIRIADLGGTTLGLASGHTIWLRRQRGRLGLVRGPHAREATPSSPGPATRASRTAWTC